MFFLGHMGIGKTLVSPFTKGLSKRALLLGTILPDLIDKPLYYGLVLLTGKRGADLGLISGSRTFGHTALFLLILAGVGYFRKSRVIAALSLGVGTHLLLDGLGDYFNSPLGGEPGAGASALLWPLTGWAFPIMPFANAKEHLSSLTRPFILWGEVIGLILLLRDLPHVKPHR